MCRLAHRELACLFHEPDTGLGYCLNMILSCFRKRMSEWQVWWIAPFCPAWVDTINLLIQHSPDLLSKFRGLRTLYMDFLFRFKALQKRCLISFQFSLVKKFVGLLSETCPETVIDLNNKLMVQFLWKHLSKVKRNANLILKHSLPLQ